MSAKPKSINALMAHMRDDKNIQINGSLQKRKLRTIGYFHGYKGYRYYNSPSNLFPYSNFDELQAVYDFDMRLKTIFYPKLIFIETAIKNYSLEVILSESNSSRFADIYALIMNDYKNHTVGSSPYKKAMNHRLSVRNRVYSNLSRDYSKNNIVNHYYDSDRPVPIWAVFETLSLGEFGNFIKCLNQSVRKRISKSVGINQGRDSDGRMLENIVFTIKDLRNAVAHNNTIFDTRFRTITVKKTLINYLSGELGITNVDFKTIVDYFVLLFFVMKLLGCTKTELSSFIKQFEDACETFRKQVPTNIYSTIVYTNTRTKLNALKGCL